MSFIDNLTPKNTEEIKPGLFVQERNNSYRIIHPAAWNGKVNWKNFILGPSTLKHFFIFLLIIFIAWSYSHDVEFYKEFYEDVQSNYICYEIDNFCTEEMRQKGLCQQDLSNINSIQNLGNQIIDYPQD